MARIYRFERERERETKAMLVVASGSLFFPKFLGSISGNFHPFLLEVDITAPSGNFVPRGFYILGVTKIFRGEWYYIFPLLTVDTKKHGFTECYKVVASINNL